MENRKTDKYRLKKTIKYLNTVKAIFFITLVINVFFFAYKHESKVEHSNYKILVQEAEGSDNYVEYSGISFPKSGYVLSSFNCNNDGQITQDARTKILSFNGNVDKCTLKFDVETDPNGIYSLYKVLKNEYESGGLVGLYSGEHKDSYGRTGAYDIYYYATKSSDSTAAETEANTILDKWNVLFGGFCWQMFRTTDVGGVKLIYNGVPSNGTCNNTGEGQQIGTKAINSSSNSPAYVGYMYNKVYEENNETFSGTVSIAKDFTYSSEGYTLTQIGTLPINSSNVSTRHYMKITSGSGPYKTIRYIYYLESTKAHYIILSGGNGVESALSSMLSDDDVNTTSSIMKTYLESWYSSNLTNYSNYIDDTVFCNNRSIQNLNGWEKNGGDVSNPLNFFSTTISNDLSCVNDTDKFSLDNNKAKLNYPIGLATQSEMNLLNNNTLRKTGKPYYVLSPSHFTSDSAYMKYIGNSGNFDSNKLTGALGVRPVISLKAGINYESGDGSKDNPYIVDITS